MPKTVHEEKTRKSQTAALSLLARISPKNVACACWWLRFCEREKLFFVVPHCCCRSGCRCCWCFRYCQTMANQIARPDIVENVCADFKWSGWRVCAGLLFSNEKKKREKENSKARNLIQRKTRLVLSVWCLMWVMPTSRKILNFHSAQYPRSFLPDDGGAESAVVDDDSGVYLKWNGWDCTVYEPTP